MTTAIIGVGQLGSAVARHLVRGGERVVVAARDDSHAVALAEELGPLATHTSVSRAIVDADIVVFAVWLDTLMALVIRNKELLKGKVIVDPTNPIKVGTNGALLRSLPEGAVIRFSCRQTAPTRGARREGVWLSRRTSPGGKRRSIAAGCAFLCD
jgi:predicted dinucleotide-binding enzyme